ncbi:MAG: SPFH domain-containing protein [Candidatus Gracilibacteria bacterium]|nr:SPFH domain-containing protein [Candidatus Gracilibacteria bacterium]
MGLFDIFKDQTIDIIRWENPSTELLVWQWPQNFDEIKNNSSLILDPSMASIFIHNGKIESIQEESGKWSLETDNTPFLSSMKNIMSGFETHDKAQIYFVKTNKITNQKWGTPNSITYVDPIYDFPVELRAFGNFTFKISDLENFWVNYVANQSEVATDEIRMIIIDRIAQTIASLFAKKKVSYNEIDAFTVDIAKELLAETKDDFSKLGLELTDFRIEDINFTEKTQNFIDKITDKSADVAAIKKTGNIDNNSMNNYSKIEQLNAMNTAAAAGGSAGDMMGAGIGMAMGMNMGNQMNNMGNNNTNQKQEDSLEDKLLKIKNLFDKGLIDESDYKKKKDEILSSMY